MRRILHVDRLPSRLAQTAVDCFEPGMRLVTPNFEAGRRLQRVLARSVPVITLTQWARRLLGAQGWSLLKPYETQYHLQDALDGLSWEYLGPIIERPTTLQQLLKTIGELQRARITPAMLTKVADPGRERDVAHAYDAYFRLCRATARFDPNGAEFFAGQLPELPRCPTLVHGYAYLDDSQLHLLDRLLATGSVVTLPELPETSLRHVRTRHALTLMGFTEAA